MSSNVMDDRSHIPRKIPSGNSYNREGVSNSTILPASMTQILSYPIMVRNRSKTDSHRQYIDKREDAEESMWARYGDVRAIHNIVRSANSLAIVSWILLSVS
jgi:hypothetical protein